MTKEEKSVVEDLSGKAMDYRSASEVLQMLYGTNVSPALMISASRPVHQHFRVRESAIFLGDGDKSAYFQLPVRSGSNGWEPPDDLSPSFFDEIEILTGSSTLARYDGSYTIVETAARQLPLGADGDTEHWSLLFSCYLPPQVDGFVKRNAGEVRLLLLNEGYKQRCPYSGRSNPAGGTIPFTRNAVEDHDLIAVYAAYFNQMLRDLSFVPLRLIEAEWNKALHRQLQAQSGEERNRAGLPWGENAPPETPTITLSLDLRKSTFAMQQTRDRHAYAKWLEGVAELSRSVTLRNGGIFDKFTGDGVICHFVHPAGCATARQQTVAAAITCAVELIHAMELHIIAVMPQLKFQSRAFGPAIGMASDMATWSLDRDGKPVVVGQGIVNACRLNGGVAGTVLLANDLKCQIEIAFDSIAFEEHDLNSSHKEFPEAMQVWCWRFSGRDTQLGRDQHALQWEVDRVREEIHKPQSG